MKTALLIVIALAGVTGFAVASLVLVTYATVRLILATASWLAGAVLLFWLSLQGDPAGMYVGMLAMLGLTVAWVLALIRYGNALNERMSAPIPQVPRRERQVVGR